MQIFSLPKLGTFSGETQHKDPFTPNKELTKAKLAMIPKSNLASQ